MPIRFGRPAASKLNFQLFPSWLGGFDGNHPTLDGLDRGARVRTLENGLITLSEIDGLVALMKNPKVRVLTGVID